MLPTYSSPGNRVPGDTGVVVHHSKNAAPMSPLGLGRVKTPGGSIDAPRSRRGGHARSFFRIGGSLGLEVLLKRIPGVLSGSATADGRVSATTMPSLLP